MDDSLGNAAVQASVRCNRQSESPLDKADQGGRRREHVSGVRSVGDSSPRHHSPLAIEMRQQVNEVEVLKEERAVHASSLGHVRVRHGHAIGSGVDPASCQ